MSIDQRYATVVDVARYLGISEAAVRHRMKRGQIPFIRQPNSRRITIDTRELDRCLARGRQELPPYDKE